MNKRGGEVATRNLMIFDLEVCMRCGYCKASCPTYIAMKEECVSPRGRVLLSKRVVHGDLDFSDLIRSYWHLDSCSKCRECERNCPLELKPWRGFSLIRFSTPMGKIEATVAKFVTKRKLIFDLLFLLMMKWRGCRYDPISVLERGVPNISTVGFNDRGSKSRVYLFPTCFGYTIFRDSVRRAEGLLRNLGFEVTVVPKRFSCCGAPLFFAGDLQGFEKHAQKFYGSMKDARGGAKVLVFGSTCAWILKRVFPDEMGLSFSDVQEVSEFLAEMLIRSERFRNTAKNGRFPSFFLHKPCHAEDNLNQFFEELELEFESSDFSCCGFGGSLIFKQRDVSDSLLSKTLEGVRAEIAVSSSPGCVLQLSRRKRTYHFVDFVFEMLNQRRP